MASTYTVNLGIEKIGTGEQSGTWGDTTNINFDIIDQAVNGVATVTLASPGSSGVPNLLEITNGATSDGRNKFLEFNDAADLGATAYVQLTPNDAEKVVHIRNNLSGGRSLILFQGTYNASNDFEVPNGKDVVLKFDGAGASATVTDVNADLYVTKLSFNNLKGTGATTVTNILDEDNMASDSATALATQQSIKAYVDSQVGTVDTLAEILANGNTTGGTNISFGDNDKATFGTSTELEIYYSSGPNVNLIDSPSASIQMGASSIQLGSYAGTAYALFDNTGVDVTGTVTADSATLESAAPYLVLSETDQTDLNAYIGNSAGKVSIRTISDDLGTLTKRFEVDHSTGDISFYEDTGTTAKLFWDASTERLGLGTTSPSVALDVVGEISFGVTNKFTSSPNALAGQGANGALLRSAISSAANPSFSNSDDTNTGMFLPGSDVLGLSTAGVEAMRIDANGNVGIGTTSITNSAGFKRLAINDTSGGILEQQVGGTATGRLITSASAVSLDAITSIPLTFKTAAAERMRIDNAGNVGIGTTPSYLLHLDKPSNSNSPLLALVNDDSGASAACRIFMGANGNNFNIYNYGDGTANANRTDFLSTAGGSYFTFSTASIEAMRIDPSRNVSIGTTSTIFESAGRKVLRVEGSTNALMTLSDGTSHFYLHQRGGTDGVDIWNVANSFMRFAVNNGEVMRLDSSGNLMVGTTSSRNSRKLTIDGAINAGTASSVAGAVTLENYYTNGSLSSWGSVASSGGAAMCYGVHPKSGAQTTFTSSTGIALNRGAFVIDSEIKWYIGGNQTVTIGSDVTMPEKMRLDSSGNLLVGKSTTDFGVVGTIVEAGGNLGVTRSSAAALNLNRLSTDGDIAKFYKDGTTVGMIQSRAGLVSNIILDPRTPTSTTGAGLGTSVAAICPADTSGLTDAKNDLGSSTSRFKDIYLTNTAYITAPSTSTAVLQLESLDTSVVAGQSIGNISWRANDASTGGTGIRGRIGCEATNAGTFYALTFSTGQAATATERMRIDSSGNLLVGVNSPGGGGAHLIQAGAGVNALQCQNNSASAPYGPYFNFSAAAPNNVTNYFLACADSGTNRAIIRSNGGIANYQANDVNLSDERVKTDIAPLGSMWDKFKALEIVTFKYKDQTHDDPNIGVIAQQVEAVAPEFVDNEGFGETPEGEEPLKTIYTADLYHAAIKALQEAMTRIETLEAEVAALKGA